MLLLGFVFFNCILSAILTPGEVMHNCLSRCGQWGLRRGLLLFNRSCPRDLENSIFVIRPTSFSNPLPAPFPPPGHPSHSWFTGSIFCCAGLGHSLSLALSRGRVDEHWVLLFPASPNGPEIALHQQTPPWSCRSRRAALWSVSGIWDD